MLTYAGALDGSVEKARAYNAALHLGPWRELHDYGIYQLSYNARMLTYADVC
jgi:hypothetical protein